MQYRDGAVGGVAILLISLTVGSLFSRRTVQCL
uniref:Uncharacterized protein n=1 Tax=Anguilla anguilla TaxID=7936 RepID=A0A0E9V1N7_ANGAN